MPTKRQITQILRSLASHAAVRRLLIVAAFVGIASSAFAQEYRVDKFDDKARQNGGRVQRMARDAAEYSAAKPLFDEYFQKYYFPAMTGTSAVELANLGRLRQDLFKKYLWDTSNAQLQEDLTRMAFDAMLPIAANLEVLKPPKTANPPYHPAVRYNAILVLGLLDEQYAAEGSGQPPKPYGQATKALTAIVGTATTSDRFPPPVILGAIIGLERHARYADQLDQASKDAMTKALLKLVAQEKPIQEMDRKEYDWIRLKAASTLARLGNVGPNNAVFDAIVKLIGDFKSMDDRCATAVLLAKFNYEGAKVPPEPAMNALFQLARDLAEAENKRVDDFERMQGQIGGAFTPVPTGAGDDEQYDPYPRRHVLARLIELRTGLDAVKKIASDDDKKKIDGVLEAIKPVIDKAIDTKSTISGRVAEAVQEMAIAIDAAAPAADEPAAEGELDL